MINLKIIFAFGVGVIAGTAVSSYFIKGKIQEAADEETKAFMDHYNVKLLQPLHLWLSFPCVMCKCIR